MSQVVGGSLRFDVATREHHQTDIVVNYGEAEGMVGEKLEWLLSPAG